MPALKPTDFSARVVWLGLVPDRDASLRAEPREAIDVSFAGAPGEAHGGLTRPSCSRVTSQYKKGTTIRNVRQFSIVSAEEMAEVAEQIGVAQFDPAWVGASIVVEGIPGFTHVPPSSRLQGPSGVTLVVDMENRPCHLPAPEIEKDAPGAGKAFKAAAHHKRGVTAWVECEGVLKLGDVMRLHVPDQPVWAHLDTVRDWKI